MKRWTLAREAAERQARQAKARRRIDELERSQARPQRELALADNAEARRRLREIDAKIAELRRELAQS